MTNLWSTVQLLYVLAVLLHITDSGKGGVLFFCAVAGTFIALVMQWEIFCDRKSSGDTDD